MNARHCIGLPPRTAATRRGAPAPLAALALAAALASTATGTAGAAELYRWVEPDGSVTFSPNPPPAGVAFDTVDTAASAGAPGGTSGAAPADAPATASPVATPAPRTLPAPPPDAAIADAGYAPAPPPPPGVAYAPPPMGAAVSGVPREGLRAGEPAADAVAGAAAAPVAEDASGIGIDVADATRRAQCRELEKRVVSLERSLMSEMPPQRMDDTVLNMARYQENARAVTAEADAATRPRRGPTRRAAARRVPLSRRRATSPAYRQRSRDVAPARYLRRRPPTGPLEPVPAARRQ